MTMLIGFFLLFIVVSGIFDVSYIGSNYTCYNNKFYLARWWARLDYCLVNATWISECDSYVLNHLLRIFSDHALLLKVFVKARFSGLLTIGLIFKIVMQ